MSAWGTWVFIGALCLFAFVFIGLVFMVADDHRRIRTLIEAHNALATDFANSMQFIRAFENAVESENKNTYEARRQT